MPYRRRYERRESTRRPEQESAFRRTVGAGIGRAVSSYNWEKPIHRAIPWITAASAAAPPIYGVPVAQIASAGIAAVHQGYHWLFDDDEEREGDRRSSESRRYGSEYSELDDYMRHE